MRPGCRAVASRIVLIVVLAGAPACFSEAATAADPPSPAVARAQVSLHRSKPQRRVILLGLRTRGHLGRFVSRASRPSSSRYRQFIGIPKFRSRFGASPHDRRHVMRFLRGRPGVRRVELNSTRTVALAVMKSGAARRTFCAVGHGAPTRGLCIPGRLRRSVGLISAGERYGAVSAGARARSAPLRRRGTNEGNPQGSQPAAKTGPFTPNQLSIAYGADALHDQGLEGKGIRVATLSAQPIHDIGLGAWAKCFGLPKPRVRSVAMPSANLFTAVPSTEEALDIEALASLAPRLERITPIFVPLDQSFGHSFALFMFGVLDRSRLDGHLPDVLSISDAQCEPTFTSDQLALAQRMLREASALGITALGASGDSGFLGCTIGRGAEFPNTSRFVVGVGGTDLSLDARNEIADQTVWSTFATEGSNGAGTGGGPSSVWKRPPFQRAPGIGPELQRGKRTRLSPDVGAMASFKPGIAILDQGQGGWGADGGTSAATPLTAAMIALVDEQENRAGRPPLGSLPPLLYRLARGPAYHSVIYDVTQGTSSRKPHSPAARTPAGGAAQPGYDFATGLGSLDAAAFADAVAGQAP